MIGACAPFPAADGGPHSHIIGVAARGIKTFTELRRTKDRGQKPTCG
jgi:hypothetical protein